MSKQAAIFFDIDDTLLPYGTNAFPADTMDAVRTAQANGHICLINTGRAGGLIDAFIWEAGFDGVISGLGLTARLGGEVIWQHPADEAMTRRVLAASRSCGVQVYYEGENGIGRDAWGFAPTESDLARVQRYRARGLNVVELGEHDIYPVAKYIVSPEGSGDHDKFFAMLDGCLQIISYGNGWADMIPHGYGKDAALLRMLDHLGLPLEQSIAVGDSVNDLSMLRVCPNSVAMGNGTAKDYPVSYVTLPCTEGGIRHMLQHFGLID